MADGVGPRRILARKPIGSDAERKGAPTPELVPPEVLKVGRGPVSMWEALADPADGTGSRSTAK